MRILASLWLWFWLSFSEGLTWARRLLELPTAAAAGAAHTGTLFVATICAAGLGDNEAGRRYTEQTIAHSRVLGDQRWLALSLGLGATAYYDQPQRVLALGTESIEVGAASGDPWTAAWTKMISALAALIAGQVAEAAVWSAEAVAEFGVLGDSWSRASASMSLAFALIQQGETVEARAALEESVPALMAVGDRKMASGCLIARGLAARFSGDLEDAAASYAQALDLSIDAGDPANAPVCLEGLAAAAAPNDPRRAAQLLGAAQGLFELGYIPGIPGYLPLFETTRGQLADALGEEFDKLLAAGRVSKVEDVRRLEPVLL